MKLILPTQKFEDHVLHYTRYSEGMADASKRRGITSEIVPFPSPEFSERIEKLLGEEDVVACFHLLIAAPCLRKKSLFSRLASTLRGKRAQVVALIYDHPFSWFLQPGVFNAGPHLKFALGDATFADELVCLNPELAHSEKRTLSHAPLVYFVESKVEPFESRPIDVLVPLSVLGHSEQGNISGFLNSIGTGLIQNIAKAVFDEVWPFPQANLFKIFTTTAQKLAGSTLEDLRKADPEVFRSLLLILSGLDEVIRQRRRNEMLTELLRNVGKLNVVVAADHMTWIKVDRRVKFAGRINGHDFCDALSNSRIVLNCNPTYPNYVHERVTNAMAYGCVVVSDMNVGLRDRFTNNEMLAYETGAGCTIGDLITGKDLGSISEAARAHVKNEYKYTFDSHLDQILELAAP